MTADETFEPLPVFVPVEVQAAKVIAEALAAVAAAIEELARCTNPQWYMKPGQGVATGRKFRKDGDRDG